MNETKLTEKQWYALKKFEDGPININETGEPYAHIYPLVKAKAIKLMTLRGEAVYEITYIGKILLKNKPAPRPRKRRRAKHKD